MQTKQQIVTNGQELQTSDFNAVAAIAATVDDVVFSELLRVPAFGATVTGVVNGVYRGVMPFSSRGNAVGASSPQAGFVRPVTASGGVTLLPFRAVVGPRGSSDAAAFYRDIRTVLYDPGVLPLSTPIPASFAANNDPSHHTRWDLLYATVMVDADQAADTRYVKDPSTKLVSQQSIVTQVATTISISIQTGTPTLFPTFDAAPNDPVGGFVIPLAYVRIPYGFTTVSSILDSDICEIAVVCPRPGEALPCDQCSTTSGNLSTEQVNWGISGTRTTSFMPQSMSTGQESRFVPLDLLDASSANWNIQTTDVVDSSIDWRNRIFKVWASVNNNAAAKWAWDPTSASTTATPNNAAVDQCIVQMTAAMGNSSIFYLDHTVCSLINAGASVQLTVDNVSGNMKFSATGTPLAKVFIWIEASGQFPHR